MSAKLLAQAIELAAARHNGQFDRAGKPYILHCLAVMKAVEPSGYNAAITAVLHDIVEDTDVTIAEVTKWFGKEIGQAVDAITKRKDEGYHEYLKRVKANKIARLVKIADLRHNSDLSRMTWRTKASDYQRVAKYAMAHSFLTDVGTLPLVESDVFCFERDTGDGMGCVPATLTRLNIPMDHNDFGSGGSGGSDDSEDSNCEPSSGCRNHRWERKPPTPEVLQKYAIDEDDYDEICGVLEEHLSQGNCGSCA